MPVNPVRLTRKRHGTIITGGSPSLTLPLFIVLRVIAMMGLLAALAWLAEVGPSVAALEILHPVQAGISIKLSVSNETSQVAPSFVLMGPTRTVEVGAIPAHGQRTVWLNDSQYGDLLLRDSVSDARFVVFGKEPDRSGVGGELLVRWGASTTEKSEGTVLGGPYRFAPRQWVVVRDVWPLFRQRSR